MNERLSTYANYGILIIAFAIILYGMVVAKILLISLAWSLLFALMLLPMTRWLEARIPHKPTAIMMSIAVLFLLFTGVLALLSTQVYALANELPTLFNKFDKYIVQLSEFANEQLGVSYENQAIELKNISSSLQKIIASTLGSFLSDTLTTLGMLGIIPVFIFFMLSYRKRIFEFVIRLEENEQDAAKVIRIIRDASSVVEKYLRGMFIDTIIVAILAGIVFVSLGIKHALFFAVFVAIMNLIPFVGVFIASAVSISYAFITKDSLLFPVLVMLLLWGIQIVENNVIKPYILGKEIDLNPIAVIVVVISGGMMWGASGMMLFIPILGAIKVVLRDTDGLEPYAFLMGD